MLKNDLVFIFNKNEISNYFFFYVNLFFTTVYLAPVVKWAQRKHKLLLKIVQNNIANEVCIF